MTPSHYETTNPYLATFLHCSGATLISFTRVSPRRFVFRFVADEKLHTLLRAWWSNTPTVLVPARIFGSLQRLRSLVRGSPLCVTQECQRPAVASPDTPADHAE